MNVHDYTAAVWRAIDFWLIGVGLIFALFCYILRRLDRAPDSSFKFHDFFTSGDWNGKASVARLGYFAALLTHSLVLLHKEIKHPEGVDYAMASLYALIWSGAYVALKAIEAKTQSIQTPKPQEP